jgi:hypothetical protein
MNRLLQIATFLASIAGICVAAEKPVYKTDAELDFPPKLPNGASSVTETSPDFLKAPDGFPTEIAIAKTAPTVDFAFYPVRTTRENRGLPGETASR